MIDSMSGAQRLLTSAALLLATVSAGCQTAPTVADSSGAPGASAPKAAKPAKPAAAPVPGSVGESAYDFELKDSNGKTVRLSDFKGKVVVLDFWATWCPPCRKEIPGFVNLHNNYQAKGVEVIGVSLDRGWPQVKTFMQEYRISYTILLGDQKLTEMYGGFTGIPTTFVIDRNGVIRDVHTGYMPEETFEESVKLLL